MKRNRSSFLILGFVIGLLITFVSGIWAHTEADPFVTFLYAGKPLPGKSPKIVGSVLVWNDADNLSVKYQLNGDWQLVSTHLHVATSLADIPQTNAGNPKVGHFDFYRPYVPGENSDVYEIPLGWTSGTTLFIAAHAVVRTMCGNSGDVCSLASNLPDVVFVSLSHPATGGWAYFDVMITGDSILDGSHLGWCIDTDAQIEPYPTFANVYLPYNCPPYTLPSGIIEYPENLDLVNWIINQDFVGQLSPTPGAGAYTYGDVQRAIWQLIEDNPLGDGAGLGPWSQDRADEILAAAYANGEGFVPACGQKVAIILVPTSGVLAQIVFMEFPISCEPCYRDETAWAGDGDDGPLKTFPGSSWALYFNYIIQ